MQIFKNTLLACSLVIAASPLCLRAADNAAQAAARAALQQKMRELGGAPPVESRPASPVTAPPKPAEPAMAAPVPMPRPAPAVSRPAISKPSGASPDLIEQAREATRARLRELQGDPETSIPAGQETAAPEPKSAVTPSFTPASPPPPTPAIEPYVPANKSWESAHEDKDVKKEREADAKREKAEAKAQADAEKAAAKQAAKEAKKHGTMEPLPEFTPIQGPASSLTATKEQRLQDLTDKYRADQISAEEYHEQRAKILAEP